MPVERQLVQIDVGGGVDQKTASDHVVAGKYRSLKNTRSPSAGQVEKRPGNTVVATTMGGAAISSKSRLVPAGDELLVLSGNSIGSYSPTVGTDIVLRDELSEAVATSSIVASSEWNTGNIDQASGGGFIVTCWVDENASFYLTLEDGTTGARKFSQKKILSGGGLVRTLYMGGYFFVLYLDASSNLRCVKIDPVAGTIASPVTLLATISGVSADALSDRIVVAYSAAANPLTMACWDATLTIKGVLNTTETTASSPLAVCCTTGERTWVAYAVTVSGTKYIRLAAYAATDALTETVAPFEFCHSTTSHLNAGLARLSSTQVACVVTRASTVSTYSSSVAPLPWPKNILAGVGTTSRTLAIDPNYRQTFGCELASTPFVRSGKVYVWVYAGGAPTQLPAPLIGVSDAKDASAVLVDLRLDVTAASVYTARPVSRACTRTCTWQASTAWRPCSSLQVGTNKYAGFVRVVREAGRVAGARVVADFAPQSIAARLGSEVHISGGIPSYWDGSQLGEIGFEGSPMIELTGQTVAGGGLTTTATYNYVAVYEFVDSRGVIHRGTPSAPYAITLTGTQNGVLIQASTLALTTRQDVGTSYFPAVQVAIYRTLANSSGPYYRTSNSRYLVNDVTFEAVSGTESAYDSTIQAHEQLYTKLSGTATAVVDNVCPPSLRCLTTHRGRLFGIADDGRTVWFSKQWVEGEAVAFADEFTIQLDDDVVALASLDTSLVIFGKSRIWVLGGDGPLDSAIGGYDAPSRVSTDVGCSDANSILATQAGIVFRSSTGQLYLLDRGGNVNASWGLSVIQDVQANGTTSSAVVHPSGQLLYIACDNGGSTGVRLVYDYVLDRWSTDYLHGRTTANVRVASMCVLGSTLYWLDNDGFLYKEDPSTYLDDGNWVTMSGQIAEVKLNTLMGYQRAADASIRCIRYTPHDVTLSLYSDYSSTPQRAVTWSDATIASMPDEELDADFVYQLCESASLAFSDATPTGGGSVGTGRGMAVSSIVFEIGVYSGGARVSPTQRS